MGGQYGAKSMTQRKRWRTTKAVQLRARELRSEQTPAEQRLWSRLRQRQLLNLRFRRQHPVGTYIVDFYCPARNLVVEVDGDSHADKEEYDAERTEWLESQGYRVIRFTNREVENELDAVLEEIARKCRQW